MEIEFSPTALKDLSLIKRSHSKATKNRLIRILQSIKETPFLGFASPEALKMNWQVNIPVNFQSKL